MTLKDYLPHHSLREHIQCYRIVSSEIAKTNRVLPNDSFALSFILKGGLDYSANEGKWEIPSAAISGPRNSVRYINYEASSSTLVVLFKDLGLSSFFKFPMHELYEKTVDLNHFVASSKISQIQNQLFEAKNQKEAVQIVESFLLSIFNLSTSDFLIQNAYREISVNKGVLKIHQLANHLNSSQDVLEKRFRKLMGFSPKQFANHVRLKRLVRQSPQVSLTQMALDAGYFDQAHFIKDFKRFTGQTPKSFYNNPTFW